MHPASILNAALRSLNPSGPAGFEGLVAYLLSKITGTRFAVAASGRQEGRDARTVGFSTQIAVECKRYRSETPLDERALLGELVQACQSIPDLDLWVLISSREVPDQIELSLRNAAAKQGITCMILDSADDGGGRLAVLCAGLAVDTLSWLPESAHSAVTSALEQLGTDSDFTNTWQSLERDFSAPWIGFDQARRASHVWLRKALADGTHSKAAFLQHLAVSEALPRTGLLSALSAWFGDVLQARKPLVVLGEEGNGKTWLVADWLNRKIDTPDFPLVLFVQASFAAATSTMSLMSAALDRVLGPSHGASWAQKLDRWGCTESAGAPAVVLVLDGLNEKFAPPHWRSLFASLAASPWQSRLFLLGTCRPSYWDRYFRDAFSGRYERFEVPSFNDAELDLALAQHGLQRERLDPSLLPLIRKPRYFDLVVRHQQRLTESGDITVARLLYEDWRDRYERRVDHVVPPDDFNDWLKRIADRARTGEQELQPKTLQDDFPPLDDADRRRLFDELVSSGVVTSARNGRFKVSADRLQMGLGFLLVDRLDDARQRSADLAETIASWMEPAAGIDEKAGIVEHAVLHALVLPGCSDLVRVALLQCWLSLQNRDDPQCSDFVRYLPQAPDAYFKLAQELWAPGHDNPWGQQRFLEGVLRWQAAPNVSQRAVHYATEWLGYVYTYPPPASEPKADDPHEQSRVRHRQSLESHLSGRTPEGALDLGAFHLVFVDNEAVSRLGRMALAFISDAARTPYAHALAVALMAEALGGHASKIDLIAWVIRTAPDATALAAAIIYELDNLLQIKGFPRTLTAAHWLLRCEGSVEAIERKRHLPAEPITSWQRELLEIRKDPCKSMFALNRQECIGCLAREDVPILSMAERAAAHVLDPEFPISHVYRERARALTSIIDNPDLWQSRHHTVAEFQLEKAETVMLVCQPEYFTERLRAVFSDAPNRSPDSVWAISNHLDAYDLFLDDATRAQLQSSWATLSSRVTGDNSAQTEWQHFGALLPLWSAHEQFRQLLARPAEALDLRDFELDFKELPPGLEDQLSIPDDAASFRRAVWFLSRSPTFLRSSHFQISLQHVDSFIRSQAMKALFRFGGHDLVNQWAAGPWAHDPSMHVSEACFGSLLLAKAGDIPPDVAITRMHPAYVFDLGELRQWSIAVTEVVAHYIVSWLGGIKANMSVNIVRLPAMRVSDDLSAAPENPFKTQVSDIAPDRSVTFINPTSIWGGMYLQGGSGDLKPFEQETTQEWRERFSRVQDAATAARQSGHHWLDQRVPADAIEHLLQAHPQITSLLVDLLNSQEIAADAFITNSYGLLVAVCGYLLKVEPDAGLRFYRRLKARQSCVTHRTGGTQLEWADEVLFRALATPAVMETWNEALDRCRSDADLMTMSLLAHRGEARQWLVTRVAQDLASDRPFYRARAIVVSGFLGIEIPTPAPDTWLGEVATTATRALNRGLWSKHWYGRFLTATTDVEAAAAFRLLLKVADRRFWMWRDELEGGAAMVNRERRRTCYVKNISTLKRAIEQNSKDLDEHFLGTKVAKDQVWPWLTFE